jgi:hypothetical protein
MSTVERKNMPKEQEDNNIELQRELENAMEFCRATKSLAERQELEPSALEVVLRTFGDVEDKLKEYPFCSISTSSLEQLSDRLANDKAFEESYRKSKLNVIHFLNKKPKSDTNTVRNEMYESLRIIQASFTQATQTTTG